MRATLTALCAALLLLVAPSCGGGDGESDEFVAQVNAVCAEYRPKLQLLTPPTVDVEEWAAVGADMGDLLEASVNELRLLEPPEELGAGYADWLDLRARILTTMREVQVAGGSHDEAAAAAGLARAAEAIAEADRLAEDLGFEECSPTGVRTSE